MSISTYAELQTAVANWLDRSGDAALTARVPEFIALAEARLRRKVRIGTGVTTMSDVSSATHTLPAGVGEIQSLTLRADGREYPIPVVTRARLADIRNAYAPTGRPVAATQGNGVLLLGPAPDATYTIDVQHFAPLAALSDASPTNPLLTWHPDVYLYATLVSAEPYLEHDARVALWKTQLDEALLELDIAEDRAQFSARPGSARLPRVF